MDPSVTETNFTNYQRRSARPMLIVVATVLGGWALLVALIVYGNRNPGFTSSPAIGRKFEQFNLQPLVGATDIIGPRDIIDKVVVLNFWGTWCGYCRLELVDLVALHTRHENNPNFQLVSVSCDGSVAAEDEHTLRQETETFLKSKNYSFPVHFDPGGVTRRAIVELAEFEQQGFVFPTTLILDRGGTVQAIFPGYGPEVGKQISETVDRLLANSK